MQTAHRRLMWHGMFLFLIGLITGFAEGHFVNVRMGLAAHLEGHQRQRLPGHGVDHRPPHGEPSLPERRIGWPTNPLDNDPT